MSEAVPTVAELEALGPDRAAALWLERLQRDEPNQDGGRFQQWFDADPAHGEAWTRATALLDALDEADTLDFVAMRREALAYRPRPTARTWLPYAIAASVAAAVALAALVNFGPFTRGGSEQQLASAGQTAPQVIAASHYSTPVGQRSTVDLADGSKVMLDSDSAVDVTYGGGQRSVRLVRGQAYFDVAHDSAHPFRVAAGGRIVSVLGTRFNIRLSSAETRIVLVEGSIGVSRGQDPTRPAGGEIARLRPGQQLLVRVGLADAISPVDAERQLEWRNGFVQFDNEPLSAAVEQLNRYSENKLLIADASIADLRVSGGFRAGDIDGFAETLSALYPVRVVATGRGDRQIVRR